MKSFLKIRPTLKLERLAVFCGKSFVVYVVIGWVYLDGRVNNHGFSKIILAVGVGFRSNRIKCAWRGSIFNEFLIKFKKRDSLVQ